jgi:hypothetical protein
MLVVFNIEMFLTLRVSLLFITINSRKLYVGMWNCLK